ncbi:hypothetical protein GTU79_13380 [Sodalis ligni]|nr:hypothetical protein GTU79_13380 [Sodalis ligni]
MEASVAATIDLLDDDHLPETLCITGGEPTMLNEGLIRIVGKIAQRSPLTLIHLLTNGRFLLRAMSPILRRRLAAICWSASRFCTCFRHS